jgi:hypoxanthine phosphoribosyltransferase
LKNSEDASQNTAPGEVLLDSAAIQKRVVELGRQITEDYRGKKPVVVGALKGALLFLADLIRTIPLELSCDFIAASSYGSSTSSSGQIRILKDLDQNPEGKDVLLVEDIVDTGWTLEYLIQTLRTRNPRSLKVVTLLDKPSRRRTDVPLDYVGFEVPNRFLVGYGLDYAERYRNLPDIRVFVSGERGKV